MDLKTPRSIKLRKSIGQRLHEQNEHKATPELKTPMTRSRRRSVAIQSEKKSMKRTSKRRLLSMCDDVFSIETLTESANLQKRLTIHDNKKLFQKCFVNLDPLTPNKLDLVKTITSPLVQIRNAIQTSALAINNQSADSISKPDEGDDIPADKPDKDINQNNTEQTLNRTFSYSDDESPTDKNNDTTFTKEDDLFDVSPPTLFNATAIPNIDDSKRSSISKRLSKSLKPVKSNKLLKSSAINKSSRLSTISSSRKPKLSGSRAIQLYEFLTEQPFGNKPQNNDSNDIVGSPPSSSSTPKPLKNHVISSVLKSTLKKNSVTFADLPSVSKNDTGTDIMNCSKILSKNDTRNGIINSSKLSRGTMPNFALIHKKQFDKMENISDYKQRKTERAKLLLSGAKPLEKSLTISTPTNKGIKKELVNSFNRIDSKTDQSIPNAEDFSLLPNTPRPIDTKSKMVVPIKPVLRVDTENDNKNIFHSNITVRQKTVRINVSPTKAFDSNKSSFTIRKTPFKENVHREIPPQIKKSVSKLNFAEDPKPNITGKIPAKERSVHTRFGFKAALKNKKEDVVKAVVNKSRIPTPKDNVNDTRAIIKGVRSNRRFDLLMKMRLNK